MGKTFAASCKRYVVFRYSKIFAENKPPAAHFIFQTFVVTDPIMRAQLPRPRLQTLNLRFWTRVVISPRLKLTYRLTGEAGRESIVIIIIVVINATAFTASAPIISVFIYASLHFLYSCSQINHCFKAPDMRFMRKLFFSSS